MSLHHVAQHLASQGRHGDSMLVHMTPHEVSGLQTLLQNHGRTLTINPHTGLPEAWFGSDLGGALWDAGHDAFSSIGGAVQDITSSPIGSLLVGAALMAAGVPPQLAGLATGGASLASGNSFKQSVMSGLSAYGGASMAEGMGVGEAAAGAGGTGEAAATLPGGTPAPAPAPVIQPTPVMQPAPVVQPVVASPLEATVAGNADKAALLGNSGYGAGMTGAETSAFDAGMQAASGAAPSSATPSMWDKLASYGDKATSAMSAHPYYTAGGAYALGAMTGGSGQPAPDTSNQYEGAYIRPYVFDPKTGGLRAITPVKAPVKSAANGGTVNSSDVYAYLEGKGVNPVTALAQNQANNLPVFAPAPATTSGTAATTSTDQTGAYFMRPDGSMGFYTPPKVELPPPPPPEPSYDYSSAGANGGLMTLANGGYTLGGYSDGGRLLKGPGDGVSDSIPATIADKQPARLADGEFVIPARIVSELGNGSTDAGARQLYKMMDRIQADRKRTVGKNKVATDTRAAKNLPA